MSYRRFESLHPEGQEVLIGGIPLSLFLAHSKTSNGIDKHETITTAERNELINGLKRVYAVSPDMKPITEDCESIQELIAALESEEGDVESILKFRLSCGFGCPQPTELLHEEEIDPRVSMAISALYRIVDQYRLWRQEMMHYRCIVLNADKNIYSPMDLINELRSNPTSPFSEKILSGWSNQLIAPPKGTEFNSLIDYFPREGIENVLETGANAVTSAATAIGRKIAWILGKDK